MRMLTALGVAVVALALLAGPAAAEITVSIIGTQPTDGTIGEGETAILYWRIEADGSGEYDVEIGGDGTVGSGEPVAASDGSGSFTGTSNGSTTISADNDLTEGDGDYTVYVIATVGTETDYASTSIRLDTPPPQVMGLSVGRGDGKVYVYWDEVDISDLDYFLVYYGTSSGTNPEDYDGIDATEGVSPVDASDADNVQLSGLTNEVTYYIRVSAVDTSGSEGPLSEEGRATPTDTVGSSELSNDEGACFVATAAYGDYNHPLVRNLRSFRDRVLLRSNLGRAFVAAYYSASPPAAHWLTSHPTARAAVRVGLTPVAYAAGWEAAHPGAVSIPLLLGLVAAVLIVRRRSSKEAR